MSLIRISAKISTDVHLVITGNHCYDRRSEDNQKGLLGNYSCGFYGPVKVHVYRQGLHGENRLLPVSFHELSMISGRAERHLVNYVDPYGLTRLIVNTLAAINEGRNDLRDEVWLDRSSLPLLERSRTMYHMHRGVLDNYNASRDESLDSVPLPVVIPVPTDDIWHLSLFDIDIDKTWIDSTDLSFPNQEMTDIVVDAHGLLEGIEITKMATGESSSELAVPSAPPLPVDEPELPPAIPSAPPMNESSPATLTPITHDLPPPAYDDVVRGNY